MKIALLNTGDELLIGRCVNTHLAFIGEELFKLGLRVERQEAVPDNEEIRKSVSGAFGRCDVLLVTGGLGPTSDDRTREIVAALLGRELSEDPQVADHIRSWLERRKRELNATSLRQALVPEGARVLANAYGTAPGLYLEPDPEFGSPHLFLLPGPPRELRPMVAEYVVPKIRELIGEDKVPEVLHFKFSGVGESEVSTKVEGRLQEIPELAIGYQVEPGNVNLRLIGPQESLDLARPIVEGALGDAIVSDKDQNLQEVVVGLLHSRGETLATAESCTGGQIASTITDVSGSSGVFRRGFVTYSNEAKSELLGVDPGLIKEHGAVSKEVASAMAAGCIEQSGDSHAIAVTGIAGPTGGTKDKPVGTVYIAIVSQGDKIPAVGRYHFPYERSQFKLMVTKTALDLLRKRLLRRTSSKKDG